MSTTSTIEGQVSPGLPPFRDGLFRSNPFRLLGTRCGHCDCVTFPVRTFCPRCREAAASLAEIELPTRGRIHTFTTVRQSPGGRRVPYVLARIELSNGTRVTSEVLTANPVHIGDAVELVSRTFQIGDRVMGGYAFVVAEGSTR